MQQKWQFKLMDYEIILLSNFIIKVNIRKNHKNLITVSWNERMMNNQKHQLLKFLIQVLSKIRHLLYN